MLISKRGCCTNIERTATSAFGQSAWQATTSRSPHQREEGVGGRDSLTPSQHLRAPTSSSTRVASSPPSSPPPHIISIALAASHSTPVARSCLVTRARSYTTTNEKERKHVWRRQQILPKITLELGNT